MSEEINLKTVTTYTEEEYLKFNQFHVFKRNIIGVIFFSICATIIILSATVMLFVQSYFQACFFYVFVILMGVLYIYSPKIAVKRILKTDNVLKDSVQEYTFFPTYLTLKNQNSQTKLEYEKLFRVYETKTNFYLYINKFQAFLVSKKEMKEEEIELLRKIWIEQLGKKYVVKN